MALNIVVNPYEYFNDPDKGRPIFNGDIYIGEVDLDPEIPANQKQVSAKQEDGTIVAIPQPIKTNSGGNPTYNGSPVVLMVDGNYSIKVLDKQGQQKNRQANVMQGVPITEATLGDSLVTATGGTKPRSLSEWAAVQTISHDTLLAAIADADIEIGQIIQVSGREAVGDGGGSMWTAVDALTVTENGFDIVASTGDPSVSLVYQKNGQVIAKALGVKVDGVSDDSGALGAASALSPNEEVILPAGTAVVNSGVFTGARFTCPGEFYSNNDTLDVWDASPIRGAKTVTIGTDFTTLERALDWAQNVRIIGEESSLTIMLATGSNPLTRSYNFQHPDSRKITIMGQALAGAVPVADDMTGTFATDEAFIKTRWTSWIDSTADIGTKFALAVPPGIKLSQFVIIPSTPYIAQNRYTLCVGEFTASWQTANGPSSTVLDDFGVFGGTWGVVAVNAHITNQSNLFFAYQDDGAPFLLSNAQYVGDSNTVTRLEVFGISGQAQYAMFLDEGSTARMGQSFRAKGGFATGIFARGNSYCDANTATFEDLETVSTCERGSYVNLSDATLTNCDASASNAQQEVWQGNSGPLRALIFTGQGGSTNVNGVSFNGCTAVYGIYADSGNNCSGLSISMDNCLWSAAAVSVNNMSGDLRVTLTNPQGGSSDQMVAGKGGYIIQTGSSGLTYSPALDTEGSKGEWIVT